MLRKKSGITGIINSDITISNSKSFLGDLINNQSVIPKYDDSASWIRNNFVQNNIAFLKNNLSIHNASRGHNGDNQNNSKYLLNDKYLSNNIEKYAKINPEINDIFTQLMSSFGSEVNYGESQFYNHLNDLYNLSYLNQDKNGTNHNNQKKNSTGMSKIRKNKSDLLDYQNDIVNNTDEIRIYRNPFSSKITNYFNANAVTVGKDIFLRDNFSINTPQGFALLVHELTHIKQQINDKNLSKNSIVSMRRASLERDALENERNALYNYSEFLRRGSLPHLLNEAKKIVFSSSFPKSLSGLIKHDVDHFLTNDYNLSHGSHSQFTNNADGETNEKFHEVHDDNVYDPSIVSLLSQSNFDNLNDIQSSNSGMIYLNAIKTGENSKNHLSNKPMNVLLAEKNRSIEPIPQEKSVHKNITSTTSTNDSANNQAVNFEHIAQRVYEIIERKIKEQRNRRGIR